MYHGNIEVTFSIPPKLARRVEKEDLKYLTEMVARTYPGDISNRTVIFRQSMRGNNDAPQLVIRDHTVDMTSGTIGGVMQLSRDRRFEISFVVPKGCKKQDLVGLLMRNVDGGLELPESRRDASEQGVEKNGPGERVAFERAPQFAIPPIAPLAVAPIMPVPEERGSAEMPNSIDRGRFVKLVTDPTVRGKIEADLAKHADPDGSISNDAVSAVLAVHASIEHGDVVASAFNVLISHVHGKPLLVREVVDGRTKRYWLYGKQPKGLVTKAQFDTKQIRADAPHEVDGDRSAQLVAECRKGIASLGQLLEIVEHVTASSAEVVALKADLGRAKFDRDHNETELAKARREIDGLKATIQGLDKVIAGHRDQQRRCTEIAHELEAKKAELAHCREENQKLHGTLKGMKDLLGN